ncbi:unnamed protein product [Ceratitis capitata]|uniref:(Mediterranean fruit fly) hypothetical protein n=1 Tax=Ceratitis capitata TaxID=7213 RepID=A0A811V082_CERCA|nr:unnamed protein product [Ceratitis capitata]
MHTVTSRAGNRSVQRQSRSNGGVQSLRDMPQSNAVVVGHDDIIHSVPQTYIYMVDTKEVHSLRLEHI